MMVSLKFISCRVIIISNIIQSNFCVGARLSAAVHEILLPIMKEIKNDLNSVKDDLNSVKNDLNSFNKTVSSLSGDLEDYKQQTASQLSQLTTTVDQLDDSVSHSGMSIREDLSCIKEDLSSLNKTVSSLSGDLEDYKQQTSSQLSQLAQISTNVDQLDDSVSHSGMSIREDLSCIKEDLSSLNETMNRISEDVEEHDNHTTTELMKFFTCGGVGWRRVVYLDMTDPNTNCPSGWQLEPGLPRRVCGRTTAGIGPAAHTCDSVNFTVTGGEYSRVCGQIRSYQYGETDGFQTFNNENVTSIDQAYISGVSLTHGSPRQHIWSFVAGRNEYQRTLPDTCPCDATTVINTPSFIGNDYFCESGVNSGSFSGFHADDPLWDGGNCISTSTCCSFNNPPYFTKDVGTTTDDLEVRICTWDASEDTPIELIELYVQ